MSSFSEREGLTSGGGPVFQRSLGSFQGTSGLPLNLKIHNERRSGEEARKLLGGSSGKFWEVQEFPEALVTSDSLSAARQNCFQ